MDPNQEDLFKFVKQRQFQVSASCVRVEREPSHAGKFHLRFMTLSWTPCLKLKTMPYSSSRGFSMLGECRNTYFRYKWIRESFISCKENFWPMHDRGPIPKGMKAYGCLCFSSSQFGSNLSGLNFSGSGKFFGSFARTPSASQTHVPCSSEYGLHHERHI